MRVRFEDINYGVFFTCDFLSKEKVFIKIKKEESYVSIVTKNAIEVNTGIAWQFGKDDLCTLCEDGRSNTRESQLLYQLCLQFDKDDLWKTIKTHLPYNYQRLVEWWAEYQHAHILPTLLAKLTDIERHFIHTQYKVPIYEK